MEENDNKISEQEAINLLLDNSIKIDSSKVFDKYGNYIYPTDIAMDVPNGASGTPTALIEIGFVELK